MSKPQEIQALEDLIKEWQIETRWEDDQLLIWVPRYLVDDFSKIVKDALDDGGIDAILQIDHLCLDLVMICEFYDVEPELIRSKDND